MKLSMQASPELLKQNVDRDKEQELKREDLKAKRLKRGLFKRIEFENIIISFGFSPLIPLSLSICSLGHFR